jgi:hypothetical protein
MSNIGPVGGSQGPSPAHFPNSPIAQARADSSALAEAFNQLREDVEAGKDISKDQQKITQLINKLGDDLSKMPFQNSPKMKEVTKEYQTMVDTYNQFCQNKNDPNMAPGLAVFTYQSAVDLSNQLNKMI